MSLYELLGVENDAPFDKIKRSYRELTIKYHPDRSNEENAERMFINITKAYKVLSDPDKRAMYDRLGDDYDSDEEDSDEDPYAVFKEMYESYDRVANVDVYVEATTEDLYHGFTIDQPFERFSKCTKCRGNGTNDGREHNCRHCKGNGAILVEVDTEEGLMPVECEKCDGKGIDSGVKLCKVCNGTTCQSDEVSLEVHIPAGACMGYVVVVENEGNEIPKSEREKGGDKRSGVNFIIDEKKDERFKRGLVFPSMKRCSKADLLYELSISLEESLCGFCRKIKHISGDKLKIVYSDPVMNGEYIVYKKMGMPLPNSKLYGDLFIKIKVERPELDKKTKKKLWRLLSDEEYPDTNDKKRSSKIIHFDKFEKRYKKRNNIK